MKYDSDVTDPFIERLNEVRFSSDVVIAYSLWTGTNNYLFLLLHGF